MQGCLPAAGEEPLCTVTIYALDWIQFVEKLYSQTLTQPRCPVPWRMLCTRHNLSGYYIHNTAFFSPLPDLWIVSGGSFFYIRLFPVWTASSGRSVHFSGILRLRAGRRCSFGPESSGNDQNNLTGGKESGSGLDFDRSEEVALCWFRGSVTTEAGEQCLSSTMKQELEQKTLRGSI
jgi:hypothetical protein